MRASIRLTLIDIRISGDLYCPNLEPECGAVNIFIFISYTHVWPENIFLKSHDK